MVATVNGEEAVLGHRQLVELSADTGVDDNGGASQVFVAHGGRFLGSFVLRDQPRSDARARHRTADSLTGGREAAARHVGDALGMDRVVAEVLPAEKLDVVRAKQAEGRTVAGLGRSGNPGSAERSAGSKRRGAGCRREQPASFGSRIRVLRP